MTEDHDTWRWRERTVKRRNGEIETVTQGEKSWKDTVKRGEREIETEPMETDG